MRLLGREEDALAGTWDIPFTDVSDSTRPYIGYVYANGLTNGFTATTYCGANPIRANQYIADQSTDKVQELFTFVRVVESKRSGQNLGDPLGNPGTRAETLQYDVYGHFIAIAAFGPDGNFTEMNYYLRWRSDRP